ncbi:hypothetical protein VNO77_44213 [Canavalia gladiata]|uniref:Uncharacterized protein n=1 Tax=Canavalia gladiata TaxID=3824 RepID=A0AAN9JY47_CANGL
MLLVENAPTSSTDLYTNLVPDPTTGPSTNPIPNPTTSSSSTIGSGPTIGSNPTTFPCPLADLGPVTCIDPSPRPTTGPNPSPSTDPGLGFSLTTGHGPGLIIGLDPGPATNPGLGPSTYPSLGPGLTTGHGPSDNPRPGPSIDCCPCPTTGLGSSAYVGPSPDSSTNPDPSPELGEERGYGSLVGNLSWVRGEALNIGWILGNGGKLQSSKKELKRSSVVSGRTSNGHPRLTYPPEKRLCITRNPHVQIKGLSGGGPAGSGELKLKKKPHPSLSVALDSRHPITSWRRTRRSILVLGILDCTTAVLHGLFNKMLLWPPFGAITDITDNSLYIYMYERSVSVDEVQNILTVTVITKNREKLRG